MWKKHFNDIKTDRKEKSLYSSIHIAKRERMNGAKEVECFDLKHC